MGKRVYGKPMLVTEAFVPQEYVAACFSLTCDFGASARNNQQVIGECGGRNDIHQKQYCGSSHNQAIVVDGRLSDIDKLTFSEVLQKVKVVEINSSNDGSDLPCTITGYDPETRTLHWQNGYNNMTFCHKGTIDISEGNRVNHS